tara:strand:- start:17024 stop:17584 length:561 start_codon:yes stop_codon:yes gene_type:complete
MEQISNKKDFEDLTANLRDLAYSYIEKYSPSKQQTKTYLLKKYLNKFQGTKSKKEITDVIDKVVNNLEKGKVLNDSLYSDSKTKMFFRRGYSLNKIKNSLQIKGIGQNDIKKSIEKLKNEKTDPDFVSAMKICKKRRIGPMRLEANRTLFYKKDIGILARSGFSYDISKKILSMDSKEFTKLIKII